MRKDVVLICRDGNARWVDILGPPARIGFQPPQAKNRVERANQHKKERKMYTCVCWLLFFWTSAWTFQILVACVSECAKILRIHRACQSMNMVTMKMLDYQFIIQLPKISAYFVIFLKFSNL